MQTTEVQGVGAQRTTTVDLGDLSPEDLGRTIAEASDEIQARFFSEMGRVMEAWGKGWAGTARDHQVWCISNHKRMTDAGHRLLNLFGEHSGKDNWYTDDELAPPKERKPENSP